MCVWLCQGPSGPPSPSSRNPLALLLSRGRPGSPPGKLPPPAGGPAPPPKGRPVGGSGVGGRSLSCLPPARHAPPPCFPGLRGLTACPFQGSGTSLAWQTVAPRACPSERGPGGHFSPGPAQGWQRPGAGRPPGLWGPGRIVMWQDLLSCRLARSSQRPPNRGAVAPSDRPGDRGTERVRAASGADTGPGARVPPASPPGVSRCVPPPVLSAPLGVCSPREVPGRGPQAHRDPRARSGRPHRAALPSCGPAASLNFLAPACAHRFLCVSRASL